MFSWMAYWEAHKVKNSRSASFLEEVYWLIRPERKKFIVRSDQLAVDTQGHRVFPNI